MKMSTNLPYVEGTSKKLRRTLRFHKIISTLYTEDNLGKLHCKLKDWIATEDMELTVVTAMQSTSMNLNVL